MTDSKQAMEQALRDILATDRTALNDSDAWTRIRGIAIAALQERQGEAEPLFWYRPCGDGFYEGPIHNAQIERVRQQSGVWVPLYPAPPAAVAPEGLILLPSEEKARMAFWGCYPDADSERSAIWMTAFRWCRATLAAAPTPQAAQAVAPTDEQIIDLAHRTAWRYKHSSDPHHSHTYTFNRQALLQFARGITQGEKGGANR